MIIDSPTIVDLALGTDRRVLEPGDTQLRLPGAVQPVIQLMKPLRTVRDTTTVQTESAFVHVSQLRVNQAALSSNIMVLAKGLWRLQVQLVSKFNWAVAAGTLGGVKVEMVYNGDTNSLLMHVATVGTFNSKAEYDYLLIENATLQITTDITGVSQNSDARVTVNAVRVL